MLHGGLWEGLNCISRRRAAARIITINFYATFSSWRFLARESNPFVKLSGLKRPFLPPYQFKMADKASIYCSGRSTFKRWNCRSFTPKISTRSYVMVTLTVVFSHIDRESIVRNLLTEYRDFQPN